MTRITALAFIALTPALTGCIIVDDDGVTPSYSYDYETRSDRYGSVFGAVVSEDAVQFTVTSNGCTDESYFDVSVDRRSSSSYHVAIDRIRADNCEAFVPEGVNVTFDFESLNIAEGASVSVLNPVKRR